jgi:hypothetical protein
LLRPMKFLPRRWFARPPSPGSPFSLILSSIPGNIFPRMGLPRRSKQ